VSSGVTVLSKILPVSSADLNTNQASVPIVLNYVLIRCFRLCLAHIL